METSLEASANEIAVRDDAIAGWESEVAAVNAKLNDTDVLRGDLELENVELALTVADLQSQVDASAIALEDAIANPNCPVTQ